MAALQHVVAPGGVAAGRGYSQAVSGRGRLVVVSGQIAQDQRGELVGPGDPAVQARQVSGNLRRCLTAAGAGFSDVAKLTFFILDVADLPAVRAARDAVIDPPGRLRARPFRWPPCSLPVTCLRWKPGPWSATYHPAPASIRRDAAPRAGPEGDPAGSAHTCRAGRRRGAGA